MLMIVMMVKHNVAICKYREQQTSGKSIKPLSEFYQLHVYCFQKKSNRSSNKAVGYQHVGKENDLLPAKAKAPQVRPVFQTYASFHLSLSDKFLKPCSEVSEISFSIHKIKRREWEPVVPVGQMFCLTSSLWLGY